MKNEDGVLLFNDLLGSTLGTLGGDGYRPVSLTAFGDTEDAGAFFTGKPMVEDLGYAFLLRSYRPDHGKWLTAAPLGYPDGWNRLAYCNNQCDLSFDFLGAIRTAGTVTPSNSGDSHPHECASINVQSIAGTVTPNEPPHHRGQSPARMC